MAIHQVEDRRGDGRPLTPGKCDYRTVRLPPNAKPQEKRGAELQWLPAVESTGDLDHALVTGSAPFARVTGSQGKG